MCRITSSHTIGLRLAALRGQQHGLKSDTPSKLCAPYGCVLGCLSVSLKRHKTYSIIVEFTRMLHVSDQAGDRNVTDYRASHTLSSERVLAFRHGIEPQSWLVVDCLLRWTVGGICRHAAIEQNTGSCISCEGRYAGSVSWPGAAKEVDPRASEVRQGLRYDASNHGYNGQCGVRQCVDCYRVQDVRPGRSLGVAQHFVLEKIACRTKTRKLEQRSKRFTPGGITSKIAQRPSREVLSQNACCVQSGEHSKHHFIASVAAFSTRQSLTFTTLTGRRQSETSTSLWRKVRTEKYLRKSKSALLCAQTAIASCITKSAS